MQRTVHLTAFTLLLIVLVLPATASGTLDIYKGDTVTVQSENVSLTFGKNYTFNITAAELHGFDTPDNSVIPLAPGQNVSISSDTPEQVNATLWTYDLSSPVSFGKTLVRLEAAAANGSTVDFAFTGLPSPGDHRFVLAVDGDTVKTIESGGTLSWSYGGWSAHNFTVTYQEQASNDDGSSSGDAVSSFCTADGGSVTDSHVWVSPGTDVLTYDAIQGSDGIRRITVEPGAVPGNVNLCIKQPAGKPDTVPAPDNVYRYYDLYTQDHDENVEQATIEFAVNRSFTDQYDRIVLSHYDDGWNDLPTTQFSTSSDTKTYEATTQGFSYFAVRGVNDGTADNTTTGTETGEQSGTDTTGDTTTDTQQETYQKPQDNIDTDNTQQDDTSQTPPGTDQGGILPIIAGVLGLAVLGVGAWYGYRYAADHNRDTSREHSVNAETDVETLFDKISELVDRNGTKHTEFVEVKLKQAKYAAENDLPDVARKRLREIKDRLEQD